MKTVFLLSCGPLVGLALLLGLLGASQAQTLPVVSCSTAANFLNSGVDANGAKLALGSRELHWDFAPKPVDDTTTPPAANTSWSKPWLNRLNHPVWKWSVLPDSEWMTPATGMQATRQTFYRYQFTLDPALDPASFQMALNLQSDDLVVAAFINGVASSDVSVGGGFGEQPPGSGVYFTQPQDFVLREHFQSGTNTIVLQVNNFGGATITNPRAFGGLAVQGRALCGAAQVTKSFASPKVAAGESTELTITVHNQTQGPVPIRQLLLQDQLPAPLEVAGPASTTCTNAQVLAPVGGSSISLQATTPAPTPPLPAIDPQLPSGGCEIRVPVRWPLSAAAQCHGTRVTNTITPGPRSSGGQFDTAMGADPSPASAQLQCGEPLPPAPVPTNGKAALLALAGALAVAVWWLRQRRVLA